MAVILDRLNAGSRWAEALVGASERTRPPEAIRAALGECAARQDPAMERDRAVAIG